MPVLRLVGMLVCRSLYPIQIRPGVPGWSGKK